MQPRTVLDYLAALQRLLPRGRAWPRDADAVLTRVLGALAPTLQRVDADALALLVDAFPPTADQLLPEWEATLGLPDPCAGPLPTLQQRQAQVAARFANSGGQSVEFFQDFAAGLGIPVTIQAFAPFRAGQSTAGMAVGIVDWAFAWAVNAAAVAVTQFRAAASAAGEPLAAWGQPVLQCEIAALAPAHTLPLFTYG